MHTLSKIVARMKRIAHHYSIKDGSCKIVDIIGVIDGIGFQTNMLALNTAVESGAAWAAAAFRPVTALLG
jgi:methyl-accepting chemotaxis protein